MTNLAKRITLAALGLVTFLSLASCDQEKVDPNTVTHDAITSKCVLNKSYEGKDFFTEGISAATLVKSTDGDTASFTTASGEGLTIRFYGVDTPESTGGVEKWGKSASKFTAEILNKAKNIVLEASETPAVLDSYGSRYLGYVWYKTSDDSAYKNLNLQLVENGYTENKLKPTDSYIDYFKEAESFAQKSLLHIWNDDLEDPNFSNEAIEVSIKELKENIDNYYNAEEENGAKVRFKAYIKSYSTSTTGTYTYIAAQVIDGVEYTFNIYAGYSSSGIPEFVTIGSQYSITGTVQKYGNSYQISGLLYVPMKETGDYLYVIKDGYYLQFTDSIEYSGRYYKSLYTPIKVESATVSGNVLTIVGKASYKKDNTESTFTIKCPVEAGFDASVLDGKTISTFGCIENDVVNVLSYSHITIK